MQEGAIIERHEDFSPTLSPQAQVDKAAEMAKVLQGVVKQGNLSRNFGGQKNHLFYEAWQTIGQFFNCTPITEWTRAIKEDEKIVGWECRVKVVNSEGREIAAAESMCMRDEPNWKTKPNYAIRSMSQTRAAGKALRSVFAFVAVLAGYSATPAEEMDSEFEKESKKQSQENGSTQEADTPIKEMSKAQRQAILKAGKGANLGEEETRKLVRWKAEQLGIDPNSYKICDFFLGKDDNGEWKINNIVDDYMAAQAEKMS